MEVQSFHGLGFTTDGSQTTVENVETLEFVFLALEPATSSVSSVQLTLGQALTTAPFVNQASVTVTAQAPERTTLAGVAQVRAASGDPTAFSSTLVIDFQAQRTVSEIDGPVEIAEVQPWLGTKFDNPVSLQGQNTTAVTFAELETERLLVTLTNSCNPAAFGQQGAVTLPTPPSNLELLVGDTRAWFNAGPAVGPGGTPFSATIDVTTAVASAAAAGQMPVALTLRAGTPGVLTLQGEADILERFPVAFPEGTARTVNAPTEGVYQVSLPISAAKAAPENPDTWQVQRVLLNVSAKLGDTRVLPPDQPTLSDQAKFDVDPDHGFVVRLPPGRMGQLAQLSGVRLAVLVGSAGAEIAGILRSDATPPHGAPVPGEPVPQGQLGPVTLQAAAQPSSVPTWVDLKLAAPVKLSGSDVWLELQAARGSVVWSPAEPQADSTDDALVVRRTSSGTYVGLSTVSNVSTHLAAVRVVGSSNPNSPLPAVVVSVAGDTSTTPVAAVPTPNGTTIKLNLGTPARPRKTDSGDWELVLQLTIYAPGSYAISATELQYQPATSGG
jgi:hypothetical protein